MLLRKRAWDMMREDFPSVDESATLAMAIRDLQRAMQGTPESRIVVVLKKNGELKGVISIWSVLKAVKDWLFKDNSLKLSGETDWDHAFAQACHLCTHTALDEHLEQDVPVLKPGDPLVVVLESFLSSRRGWAVVEEGGRVLGVVYLADLYLSLSSDLVRVPGPR
ncbi:MAG: CBS domain-containing protein [Desulfovibrionaceae bacterium]|nr:CBS domain-containing protein [Desulfovibrionaceae bacterium]MDD4951603.1 CBS domain-containing protein [Desulfovibrionaceae bacterium]